MKSEGIKRAAEVSKKAQQSGEVMVTSKPSDNIDEVISRPAKRSKGSGGTGGSSSSSQEAEEDLELVGTTGTAKLPHNRFACTEVRAIHRADQELAPNSLNHSAAGTQELVTYARKPTVKRLKKKKCSWWLSASAES